MDLVLPFPNAVSFFLGLLGNLPGPVIEFVVFAFAVMAGASFLRFLVDI